MEKIKVLHMPMADARSGVTKYVINNWEHIDHTRFQFDFVTRRGKLDFEEDVVAQGCKVHYMTCSSQEDEKRFIAEMRKIYDEGYDAVHLHTSYWNGFLAEELARECGVPVIIVHAHSTTVPIDDAQKRREAEHLHEHIKAAFRAEYATHFCACSHLAADWLFGPQIPREDIMILRNAVDTGAFAFDPAARADVRASLGSGNHFVVGHVGRFVYAKNHEFLLRAFQGALKEREDMTLMLVGIGPLMEPVWELAKEMGIESHVLFLGARDDVPTLMQAMDLFVLPSRHEGLPLALVEAQAAGLPCLMSESITAEAVITGNVEMLPLEEDLWRDSMVRYASKASARRDMAGQVAVAGYSIHEQVKVLEDLYGGLL